MTQMPAHLPQKTPYDIVFFEGIPGSGKSTQAQWLETHLYRQGYAVRWYQEVEIDHPLNWWTVRPHFDLLADLLDMETTMQRSRDRWRECVQQVQQNNTLTLLEAWPFLNCVSVFVMGDAPESALFDYWADVRRMLAPLNTRLVYFVQPDIRAALTRVNAIRGDTWKNNLYDFMMKLPFCANRDLAGFDGIVTLWETHQRIIRRMCETFPGESCFIDITSDSWADHRARMLDFLHIQADTRLQPDLKPFVGTYVGDHPVTVSQRDDTLILHNAEKDIPLVWINDNQFYYAGDPVICRFDSDGALHIDPTRFGGERHILKRGSPPL